MPVLTVFVDMRKERLAVGIQIVEKHERDENQAFDNKP